MKVIINPSELYIEKNKIKFDFRKFNIDYFYDIEGLLLNNSTTILEKNVKKYLKSGNFLDILIQDLTNEQLLKLDDKAITNSVNAYINAESRKDLEYMEFWKKSIEHNKKWFVLPIFANQANKEQWLINFLKALTVTNKEIDILYLEQIITNNKLEKIMNDYDFTKVKDNITLITRSKIFVPRNLDNIARVNENLWKPYDYEITNFKLEKVNQFIGLKKNDWQWYINFISQIKEYKDLIDGTNINWKKVYEIFYSDITTLVCSSAVIFFEGMTDKMLLQKLKFVERVYLFDTFGNRLMPLFLMFAIVFKIPFVSIHDNDNGVNIKLTKLIDSYSTIKTNSSFFDGSQTIEEFIGLSKKDKRKIIQVKNKINELSEEKISLYKRRIQYSLRKNVFFNVKIYDIFHSYICKPKEYNDLDKSLYIWIAVKDGKYYKGEIIPGLWEHSIRFSVEIATEKLIRVNEKFCKSIGLNLKYEKLSSISNEFYNDSSEDLKEDISYFATEIKVTSYITMNDQKKPHLPKHIIDYYKNDLEEQVNEREKLFQDREDSFKKYSQKLQDLERVVIKKKD